MVHFECPKVKQRGLSKHGQLLAVFLRRVVRPPVVNVDHDNERFRAIEMIS